MEVACNEQWRYSFPVLSMNVSKLPNTKDLLLTFKTYELYWIIKQSDIGLMYIETIMICNWIVNVIYRDIWQQVLWNGQVCYPFWVVDISVTELSKLLLLVQQKYSPTQNSFLVQSWAICIILITGTPPITTCKVPGSKG